jgi:hypothetical protein
MTILENRIDIILTAEQLAGFDTALDALDAATTMLQGVTVADRSRLAKLGPKSEAFASLALDTGIHNEGLLPRDLDLADLRRDREIRQELKPRYERLRQVTRKFDDTILLLGVDYFNGALAIYRSLKANGQLEGLQPVLLEMGRRFTRGPVTPAPEAATLTVLPEPMAPAA